MHYDVAIVGGGPAGLSAALALGRGCKKVLLCDSGIPRNAAAERIHNFVTRDGIPPREFRRIAREQLGAYPGVAFSDARVTDVLQDGRGLRVLTDDGAAHGARRVLITSGVVDVPPDIPGMRELWGHGIHQCPYCHGWEIRDLPWGVIASDPRIAEWSLLLTGWTRDVVLFTEGVALPEDLKARLEAGGIRVKESRIRRVIGPGHLSAIELEDGETIPRAGLFLHPRQRPSALVERLGLLLDENGSVRVDAAYQSSMPGVHVAGDAATLMQGAVLAAGAGTVAAVKINHMLALEAAGQREAAPQ